MKKLMKKILWVFFSALTFAFMLTGCGGKADEEEAPEAALNTEVYSGDGFKLSYDPDKWEWSVDTSADDNEYVTFVRKDHDYVEFRIERSFDNSNDTLNDILERSEKLGEMDGINWCSGEIVSINDWNWSKVQMQQPLGSYTHFIEELNAFKNSYRYSVGFTADSEIDYNECQTEFEEVFESFEFI